MKNEIKVDLFSAPSPNPVLRVDKDGTILYSNKAGEPLLNKWGAGVGEKLPSNIRDLVQGVILRNSPEKMEMKVGERLYSTVFHPFYEENCVYISGFDISDQKDFEEKVQGSEAQDTADLELAEIIDTQAIQSLMDDFYKLAHIPIGIIDLKGNVLVGVGWQDICTEFHRAHPETCKHCVESDTKLSGGVLPGEYKLYKCKNNMWDIATPIIVGGHHFGNIFLGQFFFEDEFLDYDLFRSRARQYGFNEEKYIATLEKVPRFSRKAVDTIMSFFMRFANMLSQLGYSNIKLAKSLAERNSLVDALRESEEKYRNIIETADEGIFLTNAEAILTYANKRTAEMLGYNQEEIIGRSAYNFVSEECKNSIKLHLEKRMQGISESYELKLIRKDGYSLWTLINAKSIFDKNGMFMGSLSMITDITERKQAEKALQESEVRFRTLAENSPDIITRFDRQHRHMYANPAAVESYDISLDNIIGKTQGDLGRDTKKVKSWEKYLENTFVTGKTETLEYQHISHQGIKYYFNTKIVPEFADGKIISVLAISRDITDIMEAEAKLKETLDNLENIVKERTVDLETAFNSLKESEKGLAEAQRMAHIGNWEWDLATDKAYWSDEMCRIYGLSPQEAPPYNEFLNYIHSDDRDYVVNAFKKEPKKEPRFIDFRIVLADGEERTVHMQSEVIFDEENVPVRFKGTVQDITERIKSEERIRNLANIMGSSNDAIGTISLEGIITGWNKGAEQVYGYSAEEILGKLISIMAPPHLREETKKLSERIKQGESIHHYETLGLRKDGKIINVSRTLSPVFDSHGKMTAISFISRDITKRKRVEEELRESEEKYRNIVETANEGIALVSSEGIITYVNKKMADMVRYTVEDGIGRPIFDFLSDESKNIVKLNMKQRLKGIDNSYELQIIQKDGSLIWVHINAKSLFDKNGEFIGTLTMLTDITENKRAEIALKENESRFRNLFEVITSGVAIFDVIDHGHDFIFKDMNPACERTFHVQREAIIGKSLYEIFPEVDKMGLDTVFRWVWLAGQQEFVPLTLYEDRNIALWLTTNVFRLPSGELVAVFEDITERKKADEALKESEEKYRNIVETANEGIYAVDAEAKITYVNSKLMEMLGYSPEECICRPIWDFICEEDQIIVKLNLEKRRQGIDEVNEFKIKRKDGSYLWALANAKPLFDKDGKFMGAVCMLTDITKRKEAEQALANIELARKKEIHHRIKNNLQVISSLLDLQAEKFKDRKNIRDSEVIDAFRESQSRVISMALIHEELYRGGGFETLNFSAYIEELADNLLSTYRLGNTDISLNRDLEGDLFLNMDTAIPLGIIINELISNSFKHAFPGRDKGEIRIKLHGEGKKNFINIGEESKLNGSKSTILILSVSDNGVGIPENFDIENLDSLGLQLVTSLVEQLDGGYEIKRNNGTEFIIRFIVTEKNNKSSAPVPISYGESPKFHH